MRRTIYSVRLTLSNGRIEWVGSPATERTTILALRATFDNLDEARAIARLWARWDAGASVEIMIDPLTQIPTERAP